MSQNNCRQTPWATFDEWNTVRRYLFPSSTDTAVADVTSADRATIERINRGLHRVAVWECRGRVPLAVQITAQLLRLKISDSLAEDASSGALSGGVEDRTQIIRLAYAMAVIRLVNGVVEPEQRTKGYAASVSDIAFRCGLPRWFVDLRHDATHTSLPSLSTLRLAADTGLSWLQSRYWDSQAAHLEAEPMRVRSLISEAAALTDQIQTSTSWIKKKEGNQKKKKKKKRKRATQQTTAIETASSTTASTSDAAFAKLSEPETSAHARQANFDRVMQHITQSTGPTMVRDVVVPALVNQTDGLLLLHNRERFGEARMRAILTRWHEFLESMQQAWPYFYGCLCTSVAEYLLLPQIVHQDEETIVDATAQNLFVPRRSVEEESLVWWLEALLDMLLGARHWIVAGYDVASIAMATSAVAVVMASATTRPKKKKKSRYGARARISMDDVSRLGGCASHVHARRIYGKRLFERLLETCKRGHDLDQDAGGPGGAGIIMKGECVGSGQHAVKLNDLDEEMRALAGRSTSAPVLQGSTGDTDVKAEPAADARLLTLEELEQSLIVPDEVEDESEKDGDKDRLLDSSNSSISYRALDPMTEATDEDVCGWTQCSTWQACPIGHLANQRLEVGTGMVSTVE